MSDLLVWLLEILEQEIDSLQDSLFLVWENLGILVGVKPRQVFVFLFGSLSVAELIIGERLVLLVDIPDWVLTLSVRDVVITEY